MDIYYVIGDIHGQSDLLNKALDYINNKNGKKIIFLGDYIDRGPDSLGVLNKLINNDSDIEFICLKGNHEDMILSDYYSCKTHGILNRLKDCFYCKIFNQQVGGMLPDYIVEWMSNLKLVYMVDDNIFAHAYYDSDLDFDKQFSGHVMWRRFYAGEDFKGNGKFLNHGHTSFKNGPESLANRFNLDCDTKNGEQICVGIYKRGVKGPVGYTMIYKDGTIKENIWGI